MDVNHVTLAVDKVASLVYKASVLINVTAIWLFFQNGVTVLAHIDFTLDFLNIEF